MANGTIFALLNYCWGILVLAGVATLWRHARRGRRNLLSSFSVLACAAILLFPVISADDDVAYTAQACKDSRSSIRRDSHVKFSVADWALAQTGAGHLPLLHNQFFGLVARAEYLTQESDLIRRVEARPPPLSFPTA